jgi:hypothetical protein
LCIYALLGKFISGGGLEADQQWRGSVDVNNNEASKEER